MYGLKVLEFLVGFLLGLAAIDLHYSDDGARYIVVRESVDLLEKLKIL